MSGPWEQYAQPTQRQDLGPILDAEAQRLGVPVQLARGVMRQESAGRADAVSPKGARGPMQLMPGTARELGVNIDDPADNIRGGLTYLKRQLDAHGGDQRLALAAYNAGPGAVQKFGGVPPYAETQNYVDAIAGPAADGPWSQYGGAAPEPVQTASAMQAAAPMAAPPVAQPAQPRPQPIMRRDQGLGFGKGVYKPVDNASNGLEALIRGGPMEQPLAAAGRAIRGVLPSGVTDFIDNPQGFYDRKAEKGVLPGRIGEFAGNVVGTLPVSALPGGVIAQGAVGGALLSNAKDAKGLAIDTAAGAAGGKLGDEAFKVVGKLAGGLTSKLPKIMSPEQLETAYKAAYAKVDASGFRFSKTNAKSLASDMEQVVKDKGGADLYPDAWRVAQRVKSLANQKGGLPITQLEDLRGQIYEYLVKPGGKEANLGGAMRSKIDDLIGKASNENALLRDARDLYTRFSKTRNVSSRLDSADLQAGRAYTGKNVNNAIRQKLSPLVDPLSKQRLKNATPDEAKILKRAVVGSPGQNLVRLAGSLLDPRGLIGMGLQATGAANTAGMSLASVPLGMLATATGNRMSQKNVQELLRLIAAGGSKSALAKVPTRATAPVRRALQAVRPGAPVAAVAALPRKKAEHR